MKSLFFERWLYILPEICNFRSNGRRYMPFILRGARCNSCFLLLHRPLNWGHGPVKRSLNEEDGSEFSLLYADRLDSLCLLRSMSVYALLSITASISSLDQSSMTKDNYHSGLGLVSSGSPAYSVQVWIYRGLGFFPHLNPMSVQHAFLRHSRGKGLLCSFHTTS